MDKRKRTSDTFLAHNTPRADLTIFRGLFQPFSCASAHALFSSRLSRKQLASELASCFRPLTVLMYTYSKSRILLARARNHPSVDALQVRARSLTTKRLIVHSDR